MIIQPTLRFFREKASRGEIQKILLSPVGPYIGAGGMFHKIG